jgi:hypothetical protein
MENRFVVVFSTFDLLTEFIINEEKPTTVAFLFTYNLFLNFFLGSV